MAGGSGSVGSVGGSVVGGTEGSVGAVSVAVAEGVEDACVPVGCWEEAGASAAQPARMLDSKEIISSRQISLKWCFFIASPKV